jgi:hypothetical protein
MSHCFLVTARQSSFPQETPFMLLFVEEQLNSENRGIIERIRLGTGNKIEAVESEQWGGSGLPTSKHRSD